MRLFTATREVDMPNQMRVWLDELERLPEYSFSNPTGVHPGKTWKRKVRAGEWVIMLYCERQHIHAFKVVLRQGPRQGNAA